MQPFELRVVPLRDNEVALEVWQESVNRWPERAEPKRVGRVFGNALHFAWDDIMLALQRYKEDWAALGAARRKRVLRIGEDAGVIVALMILAVAPMRDMERIRAVARTIRTMGMGESCYWYAHARGEDGSNALKALRIFVS